MNFYALLSDNHTMLLHLWFHQEIPCLKTCCSGSDYIYLPWIEMLHHQDIHSNMSCNLFISIDKFNTRVQIGSMSFTSYINIMHHRWFENKKRQTVSDIMYISYSHISPGVADTDIRTVEKQVKECSLIK